MASKKPQPLKRTRSQSDIGSLNLNKKFNKNDITYNCIKPTTDATTPWPRFLVIKSNTADKSEPLAKLSPFAIHKTIISIAGEPKSVKKLFSGDILVETTTKNHTDRLMKSKSFFNIPVTVSPHSSLNYSKGVIRSRELKDCSETELLQELESQGITSVKKISITKNGKRITTGTIILTFNSPEPPKAIKAAYLNVSVDRSKYDEICRLLNDHNPTAMCLQETRLNDTFNTTIRRYSIYRRDLPSEHPAGGVCIIVNNQIPHSSVQLNSSLQAIAVRVSMHKVLTICSIYIPPSSPIIAADVEDLLRQLPAPALICGDFNGHNLLWGSRVTNPRGRTIENIILHNNLCLYNDTSMTYLDLSAGTYSALDLTLCHPSLFQDFTWMVDGDLHTSDHFPYPCEGHVGISGNEKADFAAKSALSLPVDHQFISYHDFYMYILKHILSIWQSKWDGEINNKLHAIKPKLGEWALAYRKSRKEESILCRLRVGHTYLTHSFLLRNEAQPVCGRCQLPLTVRHVLVDCAALTSVRSRFYSPPPWEEFFQEPPKSIKAAYLNVSVDKYIPNPLRCFKCQKFGHHQTSCKHEAVCGRCGVANHTDDGCEKTPCCVNCKGKHPSYSRECPNFTLEKKIVTHKYNYNTTFPEARRMVLSLHSPTSYAKVAANNIKKDASTQTHNVGTQTDHVWPITQTSCSASQTVSCEVFPTETKPNNKKKKNDAKITPTVTKPKNKTETQKESAIPLPNKNTNVKTKIKTYERVIKPLTPTQLKTSTESIDFPPMDVIRSAAESQETTSDNGMEVVIPENSPKCKKRGKPPKLPILPPS
ncbi:RNA-directed DNA polymerase from mobile element jockey [Nymphon striatum]|nr:RNA-directed DNA polymerase from mobile element jockey [Nymphon striatum]